jgi:hypothetical protein
MDHLRLLSMVLQALSVSIISLSGYVTDAAADNTFGLNPSEATKARMVIVKWLECDDCTDGEIDAVLKLGKVAVPSFIAILRDGPSPVKLEAYRSKLVENYKTTSAYLASSSSPKPMPMTIEEYLDNYIRNYIVRFKTRAIVALRELGGIDARNAVQSAVTGKHPDSVKEAAKRALAQMD